MSPRFLFSGGAVRPLLATAGFAVLAWLAFRHVPYGLPRPPALAGLPAIHPLLHLVDTKVVLFFVPVCALMLAIVYEASRLAHEGAIPAEPRRAAPPLAAPEDEPED